MQKTNRVEKEGSIIAAIKNKKPVKKIHDAIDQDSIKALLELDDGTENSFLKDMISVFFKDAPKLIGQLDDALQKKDSLLFARTAHTLKSTCANLGALTMSKLCEQLEMMSSNGGFNHVLEKIIIVKKEFKKVRAALETYL